jgi:hypothetical protein
MEVTGRGESNLREGGSDESRRHQGPGGGCPVPSQTQGPSQGEASGGTAIQAETT